MSRKIYCVGGGQGYANWMEGTGIATSVKDADLVVFTGGADINPMLYGRACNPKTWFNDARDKMEVREYKYALVLNKPMVGICRGAQLLGAMAGAVLIQHQDDPSYYHPIIIPGGGTIPMTSLHHQAVSPWAMPTGEYKVLGWTVGLSSRHESWSREIELVSHAQPCCLREVEICYFPKIRALGIQGHPEMMYGKMGLNVPIGNAIAYCRDLLNKTIEGSL